MNFIDPQTEHILNKLSKKHTVRIERDPMTMGYILSLNGTKHEFQTMEQIDVFISSIICNDESKKIVKEKPKSYTEIFVVLNKDGTGVHVPMDNAQVSVFDKQHDIFINKETDEVVITYVFKRKTEFLRAMSDGWRYIKIKKDTHG